MKTFRQISFFIFTLVTASFTTSAQSTDSIIYKFDQYRHNVVLEKVFLHLDRTSLVTGETLWLKLYCVEAASLKLLDLSKVAYVEIIDAHGKSSLQAKVELQKGTGSAAVFIPATLTSGNYTVVAYTSWMKNFPKEYFFTQPITIINPFKKIDDFVSSATKGTPQIDAQLFPEGGTVLSGVPSRIAFRVVDKSGSGMNFSGSLKDESGNVVATFQPSRFGLGSFSATLLHDKNYTAEITDSDGNLYKVKGPDVQPEGYAMAVVEHTDDFEVTVAAKGFDEPVVYLFAHTNNQTIQSKSAFLKNGEAKFTIHKNQLRGGTSHLTIFNNKFEPVAERLVFTKPEASPVIAIKTDVTEQSPRRPVKISVSISQKSDQIYDASISVFRKDSLPAFNHQTITSYLTLTSDLHGQIENPDYYLQSGTAEDFDNLMLTHGWRKFSWEKIKRQDFSYQWLPEIEGPILQGILYDETNKPANNINTFLSTPSKKIQLYSSVSDASGRIRYTLKDLRGPRKIYLQTNFEKDSLYQFKLQSPFAESTPVLSLPRLTLSKNITGTLTSRSIAMQVQDIFTENDRSIFTEMDSLPFFGKPDESYLLDDFTRFPVMEEVMREYVKGVWVRKRKNEFYFIVLDNINKSVFNENPLILLDGVPIFRVNDLMNISPLKIKRIDVITRRLYMGNVSLSGVVSFTTYTKDLAGIPLDRKNYVIDYEGLQANRVFFSPVYDTERQRSNRLPDQRNVLLWIPSLTIENGRASIDCYTSDLTGSYEINIQGLSKEGTPIAGKQSFIVSDYND